MYTHKWGALGAGTGKDFIRVSGCAVLLLCYQWNNCYTVGIRSSGYWKRINFYQAVEKQFGIDFRWYLYSVIYPTYYAAVLFNRNDVIADLQNRYVYLKRPADNLYILKLEILMTKIICKLLPENMRYKQKRKALKLYWKWKKII